jgi:hypothetical protein
MKYIAYTITYIIMFSCPRNCTKRTKGEILNFLHHHVKYYGYRGIFNNSTTTE